MARIFRPGLLVQFIFRNSKKEIMKRNIIKSIILFVASSFLTGCYNDKSSLDTVKFDAIEIESQSIPDILRVEYLENLTLEPVVKIGSGVDQSKVSYKWEINVSPGYPDLVEISKEKKLSVVITNKILSAAYTLVFTVRDEGHGIEYQKSWPVYVSSSFREGIVVADTKNGTSSDLNLIMDNEITTSYSKGANIKYGIWKAATGSDNPGLIKSLTYALHKPTSILTKNVITTIFADKDIRMYNCEDYSLYKNALQIFPAKGDSFDPQAFYTINSMYWILVVNNVAYGFGANQGITSFMLPVSGTNYVDNSVIIADNTSGTGPYALWYNNTTGKIYNVTMAFSSPMTGGEYTTQGTFNPGNLPDRRAIAGDISVDGHTPVLLMKNNVTSNYELYAISFAYEDANYTTIPSAPKLKVELPSALTSIINSAVSVYFAMNDPVMYVVTQSKVYSVSFGGGVVSYSERFTAPAGESFTKSKLFVQGRFRLNRKDFNSVEGPIYESALAFNTKAIVLSTQKGEYEGSVLLLPISNTTTGELNQSAMKRYQGFGKIIDFTFQGQ